METSSHVLCGDLCSECGCDLFYTPTVINIKVLINVAEATERQSPADGLILDVLLPKLIWEG